MINIDFWNLLMFDKDNTIIHVSSLCICAQLILTDTTFNLQNVFLNYGIHMN